MKVNVFFIVPTPALIALMGHRLPDHPSRVGHAPRRICPFNNGHLRHIAY